MLPPFCEVLGRPLGLALSSPVGLRSSFGSHPCFLGIAPFRLTVPGSACVRPRDLVVFFPSPPSPAVSPRCLSFCLGILGPGGTGASARGCFSSCLFVGSILRPPCIRRVLGT